MTKKDIREAGFNRGHNIASWQDMPEIGDKVDKYIDWFGYDVVDQDNILDVCVLYANAAEENDRQYSPFEFTASELNEITDSKPYDVWQVFDEAIQAGMLACFKARIKRLAA